MTGLQTREPVLCVLSEEQRQAYEATFDRHADLVFRDDAEAALDELVEVNPRLVVVGMEIGGMDGLEFVARLLSKNKQFARPIVVLPDKGDPFPPTLQQRDPTTGRSNTESLEFDAFEAMLQAPPVGEANPGGAAPAAPMSAAPVGSLPLGADLGGLAGQGQQAVGSKTPSMAKLAAAAGIVIAIIVLLALVLSSGDDGASEPAARPAVGPTSRSPKAEPAGDGEREAGDRAAAAPDTPTDSAADTKAANADTEKSAAAATAAPSADESQSESLAAKLAEYQTLPLRFALGRDEYQVADDQALATTIAQFRDLLKQRPELKIEVGGHASAHSRHESGRHNRRLGRHRARAVRKLLVERGIPKRRLVLKSYGSSMPAPDHTDGSDDDMCRRVTLRVIDKR